MIPLKYLNQVPHCILVFAGVVFWQRAVVWMPEHVSGEGSPAMTLSGVWTENHHLDVSDNSIKYSSRPGPGTKVMFRWDSKAWFWCFLPLDTFLLSKYFDIRSLKYFAFFSKKLRKFIPCRMIEL